MINRLHNCRNPFQGETKRVLTVCSAGLLRSPTAAVVLSQPPFNFNTRPCGVNPEYALIPIDDVLINWADEIVFVHPAIEAEFKIRFADPPADVIVLNITDTWGYRDPFLMDMIAKQYTEALEKLAALNKEETA